MSNEKLPKKPTKADFTRLKSVLRVWEQEEFRQQGLHGMKKNAERAMMARDALALRTVLEWMGKV